MLLNKLSNRIKTLLNKFFRKHDHRKIAMRDVYFGIRIRYTAMFLLLIFVIISILTAIMYFNHRSSLQEERRFRSQNLVKILSSPAEFYLDKRIDTSKEDRQLKYDLIKRETKIFKAYNDDIIKIIITNERGRIIHTTNKYDWRKKKIFPYIKKCLSDNENQQLITYEGKEKIYDKKSRKKKLLKYRALTYPIYLKNGKVINIIDDFNRYYEKYHKSKEKYKRWVFKKLTRKYKLELDEEIEKNEVYYKYDVDLLFIKLFNKILKERSRNISKKYRWYLKTGWLKNLKRAKLYAFKNDIADKYKENNDKIISRMTELKSEIEKIKLLGTISIVFNVDKIDEDLDKNVHDVVNYALWMVLASLLLIFIVTSFMMKNLKKLEKWAISVGHGNIDKKIDIETRDEIGRLGDIFNHMIDELKEKYHFEKFVSTSTRKMISGQHKQRGKVNLGETSRRNAAFIFSDVRGFTSFSEKNKPEVVIEVLNFYLNLQSKIIKEQKGDIDDYVGDEIMAHFFGSRRFDVAIKTAQKIIIEIKKANEKRQKEGLPIFEVGIGVHGGDVVLGNIGSEFRMDFTCVGDAVNLTSRLCDAAKPGEILISKEILTKSKGKYPVSEREPIFAKGKAEKIPVVSIKEEK